MSNKPSPFDLDKLRQEKLKRDLFFKSNPGLLEETLVKEREKRQAAKDSIITKVTTQSEEVETVHEKEFDTKILKHARSQITIMKNEHLSKTPDKIFKETQEKLSYTLQMDVLSDAKIKAVKLRRDSGQFNFEEKFAHFDKLVIKYYLLTSLVLLLILISTFFIYDII